MGSAALFGAGMLNLVLAATPPTYELQNRTYTLADWWNHADKHFSHIDYGGYLGSKEKIVGRWKANWLDQIPFPAAVRTVAEYGIGGGLLGQLLLQNYSVVHYVGIDISGRQLGHAQAGLESCCGFRYTLLLAFEQELRDAMLQPFRIDLFISQAVIQHFPSDEYLASFLGVLSRSGIRYLMLQTREGSKARQGKTVVHAQITDRKFLLEHLPQYGVVWSSPKRLNNGYRFYWFERTF